MFGGFSAEQNGYAQFLFMSSRFQKISGPLFRGGTRIDEGRRISL